MFEIIRHLKKWCSGRNRTARGRRGPRGTTGRQCNPRLEVLEDRTTPATITDLGTLGGSQSGAFGINASGQVVGHAETASGLDDAFLYSNGTMTDLGTLGGEHYPFFPIPDSAGFGINASGQVVGFAHTQDFVPHAFLYSSGAMTDLGTFGGHFSFGQGINDSGQVVGSASTTAEDSHGFLYSNGTMTDLGGGFVGYGINASGQVAGIGQAGSSLSHAFLYSNGAMTDLGTLPGAQYSEADAINASGQVVGQSGDLDGQHGVRHAFLYSNGGMIDLGTLGGQRGGAYGIDTAGQVIGSALTASGDSHAFLYSNGVLTDLNSLLPPGSGWVLIGARALDDAGQIVGSGTHNGQTHAFLFDLDAPALVSSIEWNTTLGGVDYSGLIQSGTVPLDTSLALYWSSSDRFADHLGGPIAGTSQPIPAGTPAGLLGPYHLDLATLGTPPPGATHLLTVADPNNLLGHFQEANNVASLALPELQMLRVVFNRDRDGTLGNANRRGIDFDYAVAGSALPVNANVAFYWGDADGTILSTALETKPLPFSDIGEYSRYSPSALFTDFNDPAKWDRPPAAARSIVAVLDPEHVVLEAWADGLNPYREETRFVLPFHTPAEILNGSVVPLTDATHPAIITARFLPFRHQGEAGASLAEAEVVLGVDHFNWRQQITSIPPSWHPVILHNLDYHRAFDSSHHTNLGVRWDGTGWSFFYLDTGTLIETLPDQVPYFDPLVVPAGASETEYTRATVVETVAGPRQMVAFNGDSVIRGAPVPDDKPFYYNEDERSATWGIRAHTLADSVGFFDQPGWPNWALGSGQAIGFETRLVGVLDDQGNYVMWGDAGEGWRTNFTWTSNSSFDKVDGHRQHVPGTGVDNVASWGFAIPGDSGISTMGGGIFNLRYDDGTPVGGYLTRLVAGSLSEVPDIVVSNHPGQQSPLSALPVEPAPGTPTLQARGVQAVSFAIAASLTGNQPVGILPFAAALGGGSLPVVDSPPTVRVGPVPDDSGPAVRAGVPGGFPAVETSDLGRESVRYWHDLGDTPGEPAFLGSFLDQGTAVMEFADLARLLLQPGKRA